MYFKRIIGIAALGLVMLAGCNGPKSSEQTSGIDPANLDTTLLPGADFYRYANGGWLEAHPLKDDDVMRDAFVIVFDSINERLKKIVTGIAAEKQEQGTVGQKIADLYNLAMDSAKLNREGYAPVKPLLDEIGALSETAQLIPMMARLRLAGIPTYFSCEVGADMTDSDTNLLAIMQGGLGLGEREYYLEKDSANTYIRDRYREYITKLFRLAGADEADAARKTEDVLEIETAIARASFSAAELRDVEANYHKMPLNGLKTAVPGFDWELFFKEAGLNGVQEVDLSQVAPVKKAAELLNTLPVSKHIAYLQFNLLDKASPFLSDDFIDNRFDFYGRVLYGTPEQSPRWKRAVGSVNELLGEAVGEMYVKEYFPPEAKQRMLALVGNLQSALAQRIEAQSWMSDSTKNKAIDKLNTFHVKIGYPDKWKDYSTLDIRNDSYWANACRAAAWHVADNYGRVGKPVDKDEWGMTPQTVNAYYNPSSNEICFPAAILQPPFFDMNADDAFNYGSIGVVIGHEMTHGFDDQGRHFDKEGNMTDWWNGQDGEEFNRRARVLADYFDGIEVLPGLHANGSLTLGENLADHGGLTVSFQALQNAMQDAPLPDKEGFTPEQRFFLAYAGLWAANIREPFIRLITQGDEHSVHKWRVNGTLPHIQAWYDAFAITPQDPMYLAPEKRVDIW